MNFFLKRNALEAFALLFFVGVVYIILFAPPFSYPTGGTFTIHEGTSIQKTGELLQDAHVIRVPFVFSLIARFVGADTGVIANTYALPGTENVFSIAYRLTHGKTGTTPIKVTIPEGLSSREIGIVLKEKLSTFDVEQFTLLAKPYEGYLFPETYYFLPGTPPEVVLETMRDTFNRETEVFAVDIEQSGKTLHGIVTMASILEREARKLDTRKVISGILWKRIKIGMPLQVDAVFSFILGKSGYAPTLDDYKIQSPYNTYLNRGLPAGPISNPGIEAIDAALHPSETPYLYYLTGDDGLMYYAKTFAEHVANRKHLK